MRMPEQSESEQIADEFAAIFLCRMQDWRNRYIATTR